MSSILISLISGIIKLASKNKLLILNYHRVHDQKDKFFDSDIDIEEFEQQIKLLSHHFNIIPLEQAVNLLKENELPASTIVITFDDGYKDNIENALPVLKKYNASACFFIATGFLNGGIMWNDVIIESIKSTRKKSINIPWLNIKDYPLTTTQEKIHIIEKIISQVKYQTLTQRQESIQKINHALDVKLPDNLMMTDQDILVMHQAGMEIGGHTINHPILKVETDQIIENELKQGKHYLENLLKKKVLSFAYPNGKFNTDYTPRDVELVKKSGFACAVTTNWGINTSKSDIYQLYRFTPWDKTPVKFMLRILKLMLFKKI